MAEVADAVHVRRRLRGAVGCGRPWHGSLPVWYMVQRSMQNAADAAVLAASANSVSTNLNGVPAYLANPREVTKRFGYTHGANDVGGDGGQQRHLRLAATPAIGSRSRAWCRCCFLGRRLYQFCDGDGVERARVGATALANPSQTRPYIIWPSPPAGQLPVFVGDGAPFVDLTGCNIMSNTSTPNGHNTLADIGDAAGTNNGCGVVRRSNVPMVKGPLFRSGCAPFQPIPAAATPQASRRRRAATNPEVGHTGGEWRPRPVRQYGLQRRSDSHWPWRACHRERFTRPEWSHLQRVGPHGAVLGHKQGLIHPRPDRQRHIQRRRAGLRRLGGRGNVPGPCP